MHFKTTPTQPTKVVSTVNGFHLGPENPGPDSSAIRGSESESERWRNDYTMHNVAFETTGS
ncbi:hypothetical protein ASPCAL04632 [Aspergillus calidoustus]|uniref:Uncharacterized protein n=1 Tax=Aspergillus calidoustus TaxID=454130 RepID=A0A0U5FW18_ASPCI|nr:hypothetical protein ASPCAL04632 [Aspergillus calidoustus]